MLRDDLAFRLEKLLHPLSIPALPKPFQFGNRGESARFVGRGRGTAQRRRRAVPFGAYRVDLKSSRLGVPVTFPLMTFAVALLMRYVRMVLKLASPKVAL